MKVKRAIVTIQFELWDCDQIPSSLQLETSNCNNSEFPAKRKIYLKSKDKLSTRYKIHPCIISKSLTLVKVKTGPR